MCNCVAIVDDLLWVIVWLVLVIFMGYCVASCGNFLCGLWLVVEICYGLLCGGKFLWFILSRLVVPSYLLLFGERW